MRQGTAPAPTEATEKQVRAWHEFQDLVCDVLGACPIGSRPIPLRIQLVMGGAFLQVEYDPGLPEFAPDYPTTVLAAYFPIGHDKMNRAILTSFASRERVGRAAERFQRLSQQWERFTRREICDAWDDLDPSKIQIVSKPVIV